MKSENDLPWLPRKVPFQLINPCTQAYKNIEKYMFDLYDKGKIKKAIIEHGIGDVLPCNASVYLHYSCYIEGKRTPFDSSLLRSLNPKHYQMGGGYLFPGFEIALQSMKENETAEFLIHPDYAFGKLGCPPRIPGNVPIMIVINVSGFIDCGDAVLTKRDDVEFLKFPEKMKIARAHNALAIDYYKHGRIKMAFHHFREAQYTLDVEADSKTDEEERKTFLQKSIVNQLMCLSHHKYLKPKKIIEISSHLNKEIYDLLQNNAKFHYCMGVAHTHLQDFTLASESFKKAQSLSPFLPRLSKAIKFLNEMAGKAVQDEKQMWREAFEKLGYTTKIQKEEEENNSTILLKKQVSSILKKCLKIDDFICLNMELGLTKSESRVLAAECLKLGLLYEQRLENNHIRVIIRKMTNDCYS
ncbi:hypothetical protein O3M35_010274 [Rhynocoris fuscipes]|uniref:peptidylprolyl isomerase n=1 Tax=Rhynocoris fuscipes TaxID=488301 RepID=A0AAW1CZB1_9HEMI